jgi:hypothetical protein
MSKIISYELSNEAERRRVGRKKEKKKKRRYFPCR